METNERDLSGWVDDRMSSLRAKGPYSADASGALGRLKSRRTRNTRYMWGSAMAAALACAAVLVFLVQPACCQSTVTLPHMQAQKAAAVKAAAPALLTNFKESGSPTAPVVCEIYSDYEC